MFTNMPVDPFSMWKNIYDQTEATWNKTLQEMMEKESFSESMGDTLNYYLQYQELVNKMTETYLKEVNMPSRSEIADIASLIINLEEKVDQFNDETDDKLIELNTTKKNEIGQLKTAVSNLDEKLTALLKEVELMNRLKKENEADKTNRKKQS